MRTARVWTVAGLAAFLVVASGGERVGAATTYTVSDWVPDVPADYTSFMLSDVCGSQVAAIAWYTPDSMWHALFWAGSAASCVDLTPSGFAGSQAWACDAGQQVGLTIDSSWNGRAALWTGSAASYVDLHPVGTPGGSSVYGCSGTQQVGVAGSGAALWAGTAASCVELHPAGYDWSNARGTDGTHQVGSGLLSGEEHALLEHALLWSGTAESAVDLHPTGFDDSYGARICGSEQVGHGTSVSDSQRHALLWNGTAESCVDLQPAGFDYSWANDTNGTQQVGVAIGPATGGNGHAAVWSGSAEAYLDLHQFLPAGLTDSFAIAIEAGGNITGWALDSSGNLHVVLWEPVPEPATLALLAMGGLGVLMTRRRMGR